MTLQSALKINDLRIGLHLGCSLEEQQYKQEVSISFECSWQEGLPDACHSDHITDTFCYGELCSQIQKCAEAQTFKTIEHLSYVCFNLIQKKLPKQNTLCLRIHKLSPPVENLKGGAIFEITNSGSKGT